MASRARSATQSLRALQTVLLSILLSVQRAALHTHDRGAAAIRQFTDLDARPARARGRHRHGVTGQFSMMIRGAVVLAVGVFITGAIFNAIPDNNNALNNSSQSVEDLTGQAFEIAPVVLIVIVAVLILTFVRDL